MTLLSFDPARVHVLRLAIRRAVDELDAVRSADPAAAAAVAIAKDIRNALRDRWDPVLHRVLVSGVLTGTIEGMAWLGR